MRRGNEKRTLGLLTDLLVVRDLVVPGEEKKERAEGQRSARAKRDEREGCARKQKKDYAKKEE